MYLTVKGHPFNGIPPAPVFNPKKMKIEDALQITSKLESNHFNDSIWRYVVSNELEEGKKSFLSPSFTWLYDVLVWIWKIILTYI